MRSGPSIVTVTNIDEDVLERQKRFSGWNQETIQLSKVLVVGAGALGNEIVKGLVQLGVGHIWVVDYDRVVKSNLNRCVLFRLADAEQGEYKAVALAKHAKELNREVSIEPIIEDIEAVDRAIYQEASLAFGALDNLDARIQLNIDCCYNSVPLVDGGIDGFLGQVQVVIPPHTPCLQCGVTERDKGFGWVHVSCGGQYEDMGEQKMPAITTLASIVAGIQVNEALKILLGNKPTDEHKPNSSPLGSSLAGKRLFFSGYTNTLRIYDLQRNPLCEVCSTLGQGPMTGSA